MTKPTPAPLTLPAVLNGDACKLCAGTLLAWADARPEEEEPSEPCERCLSVRTTDEIRAVAREWLWFDLWRGGDSRGISGDWFSGTDRDRQVHGIDGDSQLPLWLPAGRDLGSRVLAERTGFTTYGIREMLENWLHKGAVRLFVQVADMDYDRARNLGIPADAPPDLRAARALALCLAVQP